MRSLQDLYFRTSVKQWGRVGFAFKGSCSLLLVWEREEEVTFLLWVVGTLDCLRLRRNGDRGPFHRTRNSDLGLMLAWEFQKALGTDLKMTQLSKVTSWRAG